MAWILILVLIGNNNLSVPIMINGFISQETCENAGQVISDEVGFKIRSLHCVSSIPSVQSGN
jgi:hypothetical protein